MSKNTTMMIGVGVAAIAAYYAYKNWSTWFPPTATPAPTPLPPGIPVPPVLVSAAPPVTIMPAPALPPVVVTAPVTTYGPPSCPGGTWNNAMQACITPSAHPTDPYTCAASGGYWNSLNAACQMAGLTGINRIPSYLINGGGY